MSAVLQVGDRQLDTEQFISLLTSPRVLPHLLREVVIEAAIAPIAHTREELEEFCRQFLQQPENRKLPRKELARAASRQLKLEKFKEANWGAQVEAEFLSNKEQYDRVLFSIIQSEELEIIQELYFRLQEEEAAFEELAVNYSQGPESHSNGLVGPIELKNLHPKLAQMLRISQPGQISPPFRVDKWVAIARLERYIPTKFNTDLRKRLLSQRFEAWLAAKVAQESATLKISRDTDVPEMAIPLLEEEAVEVEELSEEAIEVSDAVSFDAIANPPEPIDEPEPVQNAKIGKKWRGYLPLRMREAALLALIPLALGGWSIGAFFGFGTQKSPFATRATEAEPPVKAKTEVAEDPLGVPKKEAFRVAVNHAMSAAELTQTAATPEEWDKVSQNWQQAIALMRVVPVNDDYYTTARKKVIEYQGYLEYANQQASNPNGVFRAAVNQAIAAVNATQIARFPEEWEEAEQNWQRAIELMETVSEDHPKYEIAREKAEEYQTYLAYVRGNGN
ncbi:MAG: peptidylprolyl isomerase [Cyanobacteria bacterium P01_E01_bin.42]